MPCSFVSSRCLRAPGPAVGNLVEKMLTCPPIVLSANRDALRGPPIADSMTVLVAKRSGIESNRFSTSVLQESSVIPPEELPSQVTSMHSRRRRSPRSAERTCRQCRQQPASVLYPIRPTIAGRSAYNRDPSLCHHIPSDCRSVRPCRKSR